MVFKSKSKIEELQKECEDIGLPTIGSVKELKDRLKNYYPDGNADLFNATKLTTISNATAFNLLTNRFLIQLRLANLSMYFTNGLFYPVNLEESAVYREQNRQTDLLTQFPDHIPMAKGVINDFDESQVLVEVILINDETDGLQKIENVFYLESPLPISRVTKILFANKSSRMSFLSSMDIFPDAFVPANICQVIPENISTVKLNPELKPIKGNKPWKVVMDRYDRLMGLIAFLKNTSLFFTNRSGEYQEYTTSYFHVLSLINSHNEPGPKESSFFRWIINPDTIDVDNKLPRFQFKEILKAIYDDIEFDINWGLKLLENSIAFEQSIEGKEQLKYLVRMFSDYKNHKVDYKTILMHPLIHRNIPITILIFLIKFSSKNLGHSDKQAVKNFFSANEGIIEKAIAENIFAVLGLYYGYHNLVKEDNIDLVDPYFNNLIKENSQIKFKLDTYLDRFTIESIFQFSKRNFERLSDPFDFLISESYPASRKLQMPRSFEAEYIDQSFVKHAKFILQIKRIGAQAIIANEVNRSYGDQITQNEHLFTYIFKYYPELVNIDKLQFLQALGQSQNSKSLSELKETIELDKKYGKQKR